MHKVAIERKITKKLNGSTVEEIFGHEIYRGKMILIADEPGIVIPYPEDVESFQKIDHNDAVSLDEYKKMRGTIK